jgi:amino acid transporter
MGENILTREKKEKKMGLWSVVSIGIGGMVGAGIFSILGVAGQVSGNAVYISFIIAGAAALLCTYSFARLGATFPTAGGPVEFLIKGLGDGILSGGFNILLWIGYIFALSLYAKAFGNYAATLLPFHTAILSKVLSTSVIVFFLIVNIYGGRAVGRSELLIVGVKVLILLLFAASGMFFASSARLSISSWPRFSNILYGSGIVFLAYEGFGLITNAAEDMSDAPRTLPRALYTSVLITIGIYVLVSIAAFGNLSTDQIVQAKDYALAAAAKPFLGQVGFTVIAVAALFSTASAINATLYGGANVSYMIGRRGELPDFFERKAWKNSFEGLFITAGLVILCTNLLDLGGIAILGSAFFLIIYAAVNVAHLMLLDRTKANSKIVWLSLVTCTAFLIILLYRESVKSPRTLFILTLVTAGCFFGEWIYRHFTHRVLKTRYHPDDASSIGKN